MRSTLAEALREMRHLHDTDTGRLRGVHARYSSGDAMLTRLAEALPAPWRDRLTGLLAKRRADTVTEHTPEYVVCSDGLPVVWLTVHAAVITPKVPMSRNQAKHQQLAAHALADLARHRLRELADRRDHREGRPGNATAEQDETLRGALLVAPVADPTRTTWVRIGADAAAAREAVARVLGPAGDGPDGRELIIAAVGYGHHGDHAHRLSLELVCAMQAVAAAHHVSLATVGNWIDDEHGLAGHADPDALPARFAEAYLGWFASRADYTRHRMDTQGWTAQLARLGIDAYFDHQRYERHLFTSDVVAVDLNRWDVDGGGIEVFRRIPTTLAAAAVTSAAGTTAGAGPVARRLPGSRSGRA